MIAEGGTERGHGISIARGDSPAGPFETAPQNPLVRHARTYPPRYRTPVTAISSSGPTASGSAYCSACVRAA